MMANSNLLDAWNNFSKIKNILNDINESIVIILGASWCHKCDPLKHTIAHLSETSSQGVHWLWLDLEKHCEFLGDYLPETIPLAWVYQGDKLIRYGEVIVESNTNLEFHEFIRQIPITSIHLPESSIRQFILDEDRPA